MKEINFDGLKDRQFSETEYQALRQEQNLRIEMIYTHGFTLASLVLVFFSAIFVFVGNICELSLNNCPVLSQNIWIDSVISFVVSVFCLLPVALVFCFSAKNEDNLRQIISCAAYQKVFFEFPSLLSKKIKDGKDTGILGWEMLHCQQKIPKAKFIAAEYFVIAIASIILSLFLGLALCLYSYFSNDYYSNSLNVINSALCITLFSLLFITLIGISVWLTVKIRKNTNSDNIIKKYGESYFHKYVELARNLGFLTDEQIENLFALVEKIYKS